MSLQNPRIEGKTRGFDQEVNGAVFEASWFIPQRQYLLPKRLHYQRMDTSSRMKMRSFDARTALLGVF